MAYGWMRSASQRYASTQGGSPCLTGSRMAASWSAASCNRSREPWDTAATAADVAARALQQAESPRKVTTLQPGRLRSAAHDKYSNTRQAERGSNQGPHLDPRSSTSVSFFSMSCHTTERKKQQNEVPLPLLHHGKATQ